MRRYIQSLLFIFILQAAFAAETRTFVGKAERISDGDTIKFTITEGTSVGTSVTVRLAGVDAPEVSHRKGQEGQPFGAESTANLKRLIEGRSISLHQLDKDRYGRLVGLIYVGSSNVNLAQLSGGFAEVYREYLKTIPYRFGISSSRPSGLRRQTGSASGACRPTSGRRISGNGRSIESSRVS
jgi:endonuclease YncB( thermonuclease family)